jgi:ribosomal protein S4
MQNEQWQELDLTEFEDDVEFEKKKGKKQNKRKWREIEDYKEQQREKRELDFSDNYYSF